MSQGSQTVSETILSNLVALSPYFAWESDIGVGRQLLKDFVLHIV
jgi:hypothetical protein